MLIKKTVLLLAALSVLALPQPMLCPQPPDEVYRHNPVYRTIHRDWHTDLGR